MKTRHRDQMNKAVRVLVADSRRHETDLLVRQLHTNHMDGHVKIIPDGGQAWNFLAAEGSDASMVAIFLDLQLSSLSGLNLLCRIKSHPGLRRIPVIVMTSTDEMEELDGCLRLGVNRFIAKPVTYAAFIKAIADTFHHVRAGALARSE
jgi:CheY-like chemotaxis protein